MLSYEGTSELYSFRMNANLFHPLHSLPVAPLMSVGGPKN